MSGIVDCVYQLSNLAIFTFLSLFSIIISIIAIALVKRYIPLHIRYKDNAIIGNTTNLISLIYGVLAGLTALYLINNNNFATDAISREANSLANIYRESRWLDDPAKSHIHNAVKNYLTEVIKIEWPQMTLGQAVNHDGDNIVNKIMSDLRHYQTRTTNDTIIVSDLVSESKNLYNARQQRISMSYSRLDGEIWVVIILGSILTLCINYLFGMNFYLHIVTVIAAALMTSSIIFLLVALDRPYQGEFLIQPDAFKSLLTYIESQPPT